MCDSLRQKFPWLDDELLQRVLVAAGDVKRPIIIHSAVVQNALDAGENFGSEMLRLQIVFGERSGDDGQRSQSSAIVKALAAHQSMADEMGLFRREIAAYETILPLAEARLRSIGDPTRFAARCFASDLTVPHLIFEDLAPVGYATVSRRIGLNVRQLDRTLAKLARWHATTATLISADHSIVAPFVQPQMRADSVAWRAIIENASETVADVCEQMPRYAHIADHLRAEHRSCYDRICALVQRRRGAFNVLCHGDMWSNNLMFGADDDVLMCDFQIVTWASPVLDLLYLLYSSSALTTTEADWSVCIAGYHRQLNETLTRLQFAGRSPTLAELHAELDRCRPIAALHALMVVGIRNLERRDGAQVVEHCVGRRPENRRFRLAMLANEKCRPDVERLLGYFDRCGVFVA